MELKISDKILKYYPVYEIILFLVFNILILSIYKLYSFSLWFLIFLILFSYIITLGNSAILILRNTTLEIISITPFLNSYEIEIKRINKVSSIQTREYESDIDFGGYFVLQSNKYKIEYTDNNNLTKKIVISFLNRKKGSEIINALNKYSL